MRALVQRVTRASVRVDGEIVGEIDAGLCILVGVTHDDTAADAEKLAAKVHGLRVFDDDAGVMNLVARGHRRRRARGQPVHALRRHPEGPAPVVGRRRRRPEHAEPLVAGFAAALRNSGTPVETGVFRADMAVELVNDGPVTLLLEVPSR